MKGNTSFYVDSWQLLNRDSFLKQEFNLKLGINIELLFSGRWASGRSDMKLAHTNTAVPGVQILKCFRIIDK